MQRKTQSWKDLKRTHISSRSGCSCSHSMLLCISYHCRCSIFKLTLEIFRDIFKICPRVQGQDFDALPTDEEIMSFLRDLGHTGEINSLNDVVDQMHQPWRTFAALISKGLSGKTLGLDKFHLSRAQILWEETQIYGAILPESLTSPEMKKTKAYKTYLGFAIGATPSKKARKFKKPASSKLNIVPVSTEEPTGKSKRVKRPTKKSTKAPARGVVIRENPEIPLSKKKEKVDVTRGKGFELLSQVALNEDAKFKEVRRKSMREFHKTHPSGSGAVKIIPSGNDKDDSHNEQDSSGEDSDQENDSDNDITQSDNDDESNFEHETDENESGLESDQEENEKNEDDEEEVKDELVKTPSNDSDNEDETKITDKSELITKMKQRLLIKRRVPRVLNSAYMCVCHKAWPPRVTETWPRGLPDKAKGDEYEEMDYTTSELYDDVDIRLNEPVDTDKEFVQEEGIDAAMTNVQHGNENPEIIQVIEDAHVTLSTVPQKTEVPVTSSSHSSDLAAKFLNFLDIPHTDAEIVSLMDVHVHHEVPSQQTPTLLIVPVSVISDSSPVFSTVIPQSLPSFTPPPQQSTSTPPPTTEATNPPSTLPDFASVFQFNNRVTTLEKEVAELKKDPLHTQVTALVDDHLDTRLGATREEFMNFLSASLTARITEQVKNQLPQILPEEESSQPQSSYEAAATLTEFELKKILIDKMDKSESYLAAPEHRECYKGLIKSYDLDKNIFFTYGTKSQSKSYGKSVKSEEQEFEVADLDMPQDQEVNPGKDDEEPKEKTLQQGQNQSWLMTLASSAEKPLKTFDELKITLIDFFAFIMNGLKINNLTQETLLGPAFRLLKGTHSNYAELEYDFEECLEQPEGGDYPFDLTKPLPLVMNGNRQMVPVDYFFNNNPKYLQGGISTMIYTTSLTKTKAAQYDLPGIQDMVPNIWVPVKVLGLYMIKHALWESLIGENKSRFKEGDFQRLRINDIEDMLLLVVQNRLTNLSGDDVSDLTIALRMFARSLVIQKRVEDLQLRVESYQKKINVTKPQTTKSGIRKRDPYIPYQDPQGFIYVDNKRRNRLMRSDELYKFSDKTLTRLSWDVHLPLVEFSYNNSYHSMGSERMFTVLGLCMEKEVSILIIWQSDRRGPRDTVLLKVSPWKGVVRFGKKGKLAPRFVGPFEIIKRIGPVVYRLELPEELNGVHDMFHVSNLKKCLANPTLQVPLDEIRVDAKLNFVEEPVEILEREFKKLKRSRIEHHQGSVEFKTWT
ncbi:hypothetical protein Tco_0507424 [Tanacetum coccineum]